MIAFSEATVSRHSALDEAHEDEIAGTELSATTSLGSLSHKTNLQPNNGASVAVRESSRVAGAQAHISGRAVPGHLSSVQRMQRLLASLSVVHKQRSWQKRIEGANRLFP